MAAHVGEGTHRAIVPADDDHAFAEIFQRPPFARLRDLALMADDLRRRTQERLLLRFEEFRVEIEPAGQAPVVERVGVRLNRLQLSGHASIYPFALIEVEGGGANAQQSGALSNRAREAAGDRRSEFGVFRRSWRRQSQVRCSAYV